MIFQYGHIQRVTPLKSADKHNFELEYSHPSSKVEHSVLVMALELLLLHITKLIAYLSLDFCILLVKILVIFAIELLTL